MRSEYLKILLICFCCICTNCNNDIEKESKSDLINFHIKKSRDVTKTIGERKKYLLDAHQMIRKMKENADKVNALYLISLEFYELKDWQNYKLVCESSLKLSRKISDSIKIARHLGNLGMYYRQVKIDSAYINFYEAEKIYSLFDKNKNMNQVNYAFNHGKTLIDLAKLYRKVKDYSQSEALTVKAIEKFKISGNQSYLPLCYSNLGTTAKYLRRYDDAITYHQKAIEYANGTNKEVLYAVLSNNNIGTVYKSQKKYDKAKEYYNKGLIYKDFLKEKPRRYAMLLDNLAYVNLLSKNYESLPNDFYKPLKIRDSINDKIGLGTNTLHLAEYYKSLNNDSLSRIYAERAKDIALDLKNNEELSRSYDILIEVSNNEKSLKYAKAHIKLNDSLIREERVFRDKFARIRFETDQKEQQIIEVQNQNTIYLLGMLLLLSGIGFAIYFFRQRTQHLAQQNKMVQFQASYETETRISKRLHDELGNDIFQVMLQYQNDPHDPQIKEKLNTSYLKARDISRENNEFETDETFSEELNNMLHNYTQNGIQLMARGLDRIDWDHISKPIKITVYRVLQELMTNMQKHSKAKLVVLIFSNIDNILRIKYSDNGVGVTKEHLQSKNGLRNTEKRIQAIQGTLIFESEKDKGFKAEIKIPN